MTRVLLLFSLLLTIPRWAAVLSGIDDLITVRGIPVTAVALSIIMEVGTYVIVSTYNEAESAARAYTESESARREAYLQNHENAVFKKPLHMPELKGRWQLIAVYFILLGINIGCQLPWLVAKLMGYDAVSSVVNGVWLWLYAAGIIVAAEVCSLGITLAIRYKDVLRKLGKVERKDTKDNSDTLIDIAFAWLRKVTGLADIHTDPYITSSNVMDNVMDAGDNGHKDIDIVTVTCDLCGEDVKKSGMGMHRRWHCPGVDRGNGRGGHTEDVRVGAEKVKV